MFWSQVINKADEYCDILCVCYTLSSVYGPPTNARRQPATATANDIHSHRLIMFEGTAAEKLERIASSRLTGLDPAEAAAAAAAGEDAKTVYNAANDTQTRALTES